MTVVLETQAVTWMEMVMESIVVTAVQRMVLGWYLQIIKISLPRKNYASPLGLKKATICLIQGMKNGLTVIILSLLAKLLSLVQPVVCHQFLLWPCLLLSLAMPLCLHLAVLLRPCQSLFLSLAVLLHQHLPGGAPLSMCAPFTDSATLSMSESVGSATLSTSAPLSGGVTSAPVTGCATPSMSKSAPLSGSATSTSASASCSPFSNLLNLPC